MAQAFYEVGMAGVTALTVAPVATLHTGANVRAAIREIGIFMTSAVAGSFGLIRPSNSPVANSSQLGQAQDTAQAAATVNMDSGWSTAPTVGSIYLRKAVLPATIGAGIIWTWPSGAGLIIPVSSYLVIWNYSGSTNGACNVYAVWEE